MNSLTSSPLAAIALVFAGLSALILVVYLVRRPPLVRATKLWLLLGLGVFPVTVALSGNVQGFEATKERAFCGSCHVMGLHQRDSDDPNSHSLAARHARNPMFGPENCYVCHADYGMFGTVVTKAGGMRHVYYYYTEYHHTPLEEAKRTIHILKPFPNHNCMQCHSTKDDLFLAVRDHEGALDDVRSERVSCASEGCHGLAHPFWKPEDATADKPRKAEEVKP